MKTNGATYPPIRPPSRGVRGSNRGHGCDWPPVLKQISATWSNPSMKPVPYSDSSGPEADLVAGRHSHPEQGPRHDKARQYPVIMLVYGQVCVEARSKKQICREQAALDANEPFLKLFHCRRSRTCYVCGMRECLYVGGSNRWMSIIMARRPASGVRLPAVQFNRSYP